MGACATIHYIRNLANAVQIDWFTSEKTRLKIFFKKGIAQRGRHLYSIRLPLEQRKAALEKGTWWVWPSWLGRKIVALEVVGSNPITHPSFLLKNQASHAIES